MKRLFFFLCFFISIYIYGAVLQKDTILISGKISKINTKLNFIIVGSKKIFYNEKVENLIKKYIGKHKTIKVKKEKNKLIFLKFKKKLKKLY